MIIDFKDYREGLASLSLVVFLFSFTFMVGSIILKPYVALGSEELIFIVILCCINFIFCLYYLLESFRLKKIFKLEDRHIIKYGKRLRIISCAHIPHIVALGLLFFLNLNELEFLMTAVMFLLELGLISLNFKEIYDLVLKNELDRKFELEKNRHKYIEKRDQAVVDDF